MLATRICMFSLIYICVALTEVIGLFKTLWNVIGKVKPSHNELRQSLVCEQIPGSIVYKSVNNPCITVLN